MGPGRAGRPTPRGRHGYGQEGLRALTRAELAERLRLVVITDERLAGGRGLASVVEAALRGGAPAVQVRAKDAGAGELFRLVSARAPAVRAAGALLIVNDRLDVALASGADGVHLGPDDLPVADARRAAPAGFLIGYSADRPEHARQAARDGADYIGCGAVYQTSNKQDAGDTIGLEGLRCVVQAVDAPVVAIGGLRPGHAAGVARVGAAGCAVIGGIMTADDPEAAARAFLEPF